MKIFALLAILSCASATVIDTLGELGQTTILELLELTGLTEALEGEGPFTVFAPKQEVFDNLPEGLLDELASDLESLAKGLTYHVADGRYESTEAANDLLIPTLEGSDLRVNVYDVEGTTVVTVAGVPIDINQVDIEAGNGLIHFLDFVILDVPDFDAVGTLLDFDPELATFTALEHAAVISGALADIQAAEDVTLLAPIDTDLFTIEAIEEALANGEVDLETIRLVLGDHVVRGTQFSVGIGQRKEFETSTGNTYVAAFSEENGYYIEDTEGNFLADIIAGDIPTLQGVVHIIDRPILLAA
jgi:transforming growth factor-beta-induced protein